MQYELGNGREVLPDKYFKYDIDSTVTVTGRGFTMLVTNKRDFGNIDWLKESIVLLKDPKEVLGAGAIPPTGKFFHVKRIEVALNKLGFLPGDELGLYGAFLE